MDEPTLHLSDRLTRAFDMAREVHDGQTLKGTNLPYLAAGYISASI